MFNFMKSSEKKLVSPVTGKCILVTECEDAVFREKVLGDGVAVIPSEKEVYSPCDGTVIQIAHTFHAVCFETDDGLEILLHLGMDTVKLAGEGFTCLVTKGQKVKAGEKIMEMDLDLVQSKGFQIVSPCIITNMDIVKKHKFLTGEVVHGQSSIMRYSI